MNSFQVDLTFNTPSGSFSAPTHHFILDVIVGALFEEIGFLHYVKKNWSKTSTSYLSYVETIANVLY